MICYLLIYHQLRKLEINTKLYINKNGRLNWKQDGNFNTEYLCRNSIMFELIEDEVDIDNIEEMTLDGVEDVTYFINDLIKAVKQLNKEIKSIKEK